MGISYDSCRENRELNPLYKRDHCIILNHSGLMMTNTERLITDLGPVYHETDLSGFIVEPYNAISSLSMVIAALLIWVILVKKNGRTYPFLAFVYAPLIFVGGIGSTIFHAFRASPFFLYMDVLHVFVLTIMLALYYWHKIYSRWYFIVLMTLLIILSHALPMLFFKGSAAINVSYFVSGLLILIPLAWYLFRTNFRKAKYVLFCLAALLLALFFRYADDLNLLNLPMGTHWFWHVFSGIGAWFLGLYVFKPFLEKKEKNDGSDIKIKL